MTTTVEITLGDDQKLMVGIAEEPSTDLDDQQPAATIDEALKIAAHLLANPPADSDEATEPGGADQDSGPDADDQQQAGAAPGGPTAAPGATAGQGAPPGGQQSAQAIWDQLAQQSKPPH